MGVHRLRVIRVIDKVIRLVKGIQMELSISVFDDGEGAIIDLLGRFMVGNQAVDQVVYGPAMADNENLLVSSCVLIE